MANGSLLNQMPEGGMAAEILINKNFGTISVSVINKDTGESLQLQEDVNNYKFPTYKYGNYQVNMVMPSRTVSQEIAIDICKQYSVFPASKDLNSNTWEIISMMSNANVASSLWSVGDAKEIALNGTIGSLNLNDYKTWVYILGFNHNAEKEGNNLVHFGCFRNGKDYTTQNSIALVDSQYDNNAPSGYFTMNNSDTNNGGWENCQMRTAVIDADASSPIASTGNTFLHVLPNDLKAVMKRCTKYTYNAQGGQDIQGYVTATQDWAFLLSEFEVQGQRTYASQYEKEYQKQYEYYKLGNSKIKYKQNALSDSCLWWCRSLYVRSAYSFCVVNTDGSANYSYANNSRGFAPGFCI